jgi:hypothetical protein
MKTAIRISRLFSIALSLTIVMGVTVAADAQNCCGGPGTEMTKIINHMGLGSDCGRCKALAAQMDCCGPEWVLQNREYVVARTISNAEKLGQSMGPIRRLGVRSIVRRAVRRSR